MIQGISDIYTEFENAMVLLVYGCRSFHGILSQVREAKSNTNHHPDLSKRAIACCSWVTLTNTSGVGLNPRYAYAGIVCVRVYMPKLLCCFTVC